MPATSKILKKVTAGDLLLSTGIYLPSGVYVTVTPSDVPNIADATLQSYFISGDVLFNDGTSDYTGQQGFDIFQGTRYTDYQYATVNTDTKGFRTQTVVQATANSTLTLTATSEMMIQFTGTTAGQIVKLPDATTIPVGQRYEVHNDSTQDVTLQDNAGSVSGIFKPTQRVTAVLQVAGTVAGTWSIRVTEKSIGFTSGSITTVFNDFLLDVFHTHSMIVNADLNGGVSTMDTTSTDNNYSGSFTMSTGTTLPTLSTMGKALVYNNTSLTIKAGGQTVEWRVRVNTLSGSTTALPRYDMKAGFQDTSTTGDPANGVYFQYSDNINGGKWNCVTRSSSTSTSVPSNVTVVANQWYRLRFVINTAGTTVDFYIDGVYIGTSIANIPTTSGMRLQVSTEQNPFNVTTFLPAAVNVSTNYITLSSMPFSNLDRVVFTSTTTLPSPLSAATTYYVRNISGNTFQISTTAAGGIVDITTQGSGTHTIYEMSAAASTTQADWYIYSIIRT